MANTKRRIAGPAFIANSATNIYTPPASTIITYIYHIHILNVTGTARTVTLYVGATGGSAAGTELGGGGATVPANTGNAGANEYNLYFPNGLPMKSGDFLTGIAGASSALVITVMGEDKTVD